MNGTTLDPAEASEGRTRMIHRKFNANNAERGYTAVELVVACMVIMILAAISYPQGQSLIYKYRLQGAVASCTWAVQQTRYGALQNGYQFQVVFSSSAGTYQIQNLPPTCLVGGTTQNPCTTWQNVGTVIPISGVPVTMNQDTTLQFKPNGAVTATTGALNFTLTYQGKTNTITVTTYGNIKVS